MLLKPVLDKNNRNGPFLNYPNASQVNIRLKVKQNIVSVREAELVNIGIGLLFRSLTNKEAILRTIKNSTKTMKTFIHRIISFKNKTEFYPSNNVRAILLSPEKNVFYLPGLVLNWMLSDCLKCLKHDNPTTGITPVNAESEPGSNPLHIFLRNQIYNFQYQKWTDNRKNCTCPFFS